MKKILILIAFSLITFSQTIDEWTLISSSASSTTYIDTMEITASADGDVYIWVLDKYSPPIIIESVDGRIYKSKTYYLFSKQYQRYSMLQIIYYDEDDNVLKSFDYNRKSEIPTYKYNYPIMPGSTEEVIFQKIVADTAELPKGAE